MLLSMGSLSLLITDDYYPLGLVRFEIFFLLFFVFNNIVESGSNSLFAALYVNPSSSIVNSSFILIFFSTVGEILFTLILSIFGDDLVNYWNDYVAIGLGIIACLIFFFMYKYSKYKIGFN